ncbi:MAG: hypothetical protein IPL70_15580 [Uliginosibacterium sp.]|nr:hypothetical protein [Uliginosibacterium sp.]
MTEKIAQLVMIELHDMTASARYLGKQVLRADREAFSGGALDLLLFVFELKLPAILAADPSQTRIGIGLQVILEFKPVVIAIGNAVNLPLNAGILENIVIACAVETIEIEAVVLSVRDQGAVVAPVRLELVASLWIETDCAGVPVATLTTPQLSMLSPVGLCPQLLPALDSRALPADEKQKKGRAPAPGRQPSRAPARGGAGGPPRSRR